MRRTTIIVATGLAVGGFALIARSRLRRRGPVADRIPQFIVDSSMVLAVINDEDEHHRPGEVQAARDLLSLADTGRVVLRRSTSFDRDWGRNTDATRKKRNLRWLNDSPIEEAVAPGGFRLGVSLVDGSDIVVDEDDAALDRKIREIVGSGSGNADKRSSDLDHLMATMLAAADGFVTLDVKTILAYQDDLAANGVRVLWPSEALALVRP